MKPHQINESELRAFYQSARIDCASASGPPCRKRLQWEPYNCRWLVQIDEMESEFIFMAEAVAFYNKH